MSEACVSAAGAIVYVVVGLFAFFALVSMVPISGMTDVPHYARTFICAPHRALPLLRSHHRARVRACRHVDWPPLRRRQGRAQPPQPAAAPGVLACAHRTRVS